MPPQPHSPGTAACGPLGEERHRIRQTSRVHACTTTGHVDTCIQTVCSIILNLHTSIVESTYMYID